ncbi:hypothetical protein BLNAU_23313 [Blattamonas nauphoetae]|uniref:MMS19 nucleotide excision repair protein n=1 Tax=Blattamonas nauphoetae TaxID=2049346 RepID=A0ABQ9WQJ4_9EUKA|nr:hypothetical protein BLNAU_23313 [Blattamonas nauphoetae]
MNFDVNSELSLDDKSAIFSSLVALVKAEYPFDGALQDRTARFLLNLGPMGDTQLADQLVTKLVPSSGGSCAGFVESIVTLVSSHHSTVVAVALSFVRETTMRASPEIRCRLVDFDLINNILATMQPHTLPISGNEEIITHLIRIFSTLVDLASSSSLSDLGITDAADTFDLRELLFQKVFIPSSRFVTFLISNRSIVNGDLSSNLTLLLGKLIRICPFHRPTLEFVLASPIVMAIS